MNALVYARVSTDEQREAATIQQQLTDCHAYAHRMGWTVTGVFADDGVSGAKDFHDREQGGRLLETANKQTAIILYCVDRLSRELVTGIPAYNKLMRLTDGQVHFVNATFDDTPEGRFMFNQFMTIAQYEREVIRRRTMKGKQAAVKKGTVHAAATPSYGYRRVVVTDADGRPVLKDNGRALTKVVIRPDTAAVVNRIHEMYQGGAGPIVIAGTLQDDGVPAPAASNREDNPTAKRTGKGWHRGPVTEILKRKAYTGTGIYRPGDPNREGRKLADTMETSYPVIVSPDVFARTQERMAGERRGTRPTRLALLQGRLWCFCGGRLSPTGTKYHYPKAYRCTNRQNNGHFAGVKEQHEGAGKRSDWKADMLHTIVKKVVTWWFNDPAFLAAHLEQVYRAEEQAIETSASDAATLTRKLAELAARENNLFDLAEQGVGKDKVNERLNAIAQERAAVEKKLTTATRKTAKREDRMLIAKQMRAHLLARIVGRDVTDAIGEAPEPTTWTPPTTDKGWRELVHYLIERITVDGGNDGARMQFEGIKWIYDDLDGPAAGVPNAIVNTTASRR